MFRGFMENELALDQISRDLSSFLQVNKDKLNFENSIPSQNDSLCPFCPKLLNFQEAKIMLSNALYQKYSSSQNYYYKKEVEKFYCDKMDLIGPVRQKICYFNDEIAMTESNEYLLEFFPRSDVKSKIETLVEYYKFHNEVPRLFFKSLMRQIYKFYNKKRKLQFKQLQKILEQNDNQSIQIQASKNVSSHLHKYSNILKSKFLRQSESNINLYCLDLEFSKIKMKEITDSSQFNTSYSSFLNKSLSGLLNPEDYIVRSQMLQLNTKINQEIQKSLQTVKSSDKLKLLERDNANRIETQSQNFNFEENIKKINQELNQIFPKNTIFINLF